MIKIFVNDGYLDDFDMHNKAGLLHRTVALRRKRKRSSGFCPSYECITLTGSAPMYSSKLFNSRNQCIKTFPKRPDLFSRGPLQIFRVFSSSYRRFFWDALLPFDYFMEKGYWTLDLENFLQEDLTNLINNPRMFNLGIDDLAEKPYIPQKNLLLWICCKCLAWWHRHTYFWPPLRLLEAKHHTATAHFGTVGWTEHWVKVPKCALAVWCLASNSLHGGQKCSPCQPPYLEF